MTKKSVLIVDDEVDTLKLLKTIVEISGYEAYITLNSLDALTLAQVEQPDVVLLDIMMPKMDGFQLCKLMRAHPETKDLPVIFVTAYSALDLEDRRKASGGDMILPKPVGMDSLVDAIEKVQTMERARPADESNGPNGASSSGANGAANGNSATGTSPSSRNNPPNIKPPQTPPPPRS